MGESQRREERRPDKRKSQKKEDAGVGKSGEVAIHCVLQMIRGSGGSKSRLAKGAGAETSGQMRDDKLHAVVARSTFGNQNVLEVEMSKKCTRLRREAHVQVKMYKAPHVQSTFGSRHVEKMHAVVARSTCPSQNEPLSGNQRLDLRTSLMNMSLVLRLPQKMHLCRSSSNVPRLPTPLKLLQNRHVLLTFDKVHNPLRLPRRTTSERPKVVQTCVF